MFKSVEAVMVSFDKNHYVNETLPFMLREFCDLKYVIDPEHEISVLNDCVSNLAAYSVCINGSYSDIMWLNAYGSQPLKTKITNGYTFRQYAERAEGLISSFTYSVHVTHELIRLIICYAVAKGYNFETIFKLNVK